MEKRSRGFTLVELLIVISVISVLMVLLLPTLRYVREHGRRTRCSHGLRQIHAAMMAYTEEHQGILPYATVVNYPRTHPRQLHNLLAEQIKGAEQIFQCPSDTGTSSIGDYFPYFGSSYQTRGDMTNATGWGITEEEYKPFGGRPVDYFHAPSILAILRDGLGWHDLGSSAGPGSTKGEQFLFLDGHTAYDPDEKWWGYGGGIK